MAVDLEPCDARVDGPIGMSITMEDGIRPAAAWHVLVSSGQSGT